MVFIRDIRNKIQLEVAMFELNETELEIIAGGNRRLELKITNTNNSTITLHNFSVKGSGGLLIAVTQSIG